MKKAIFNSFFEFICYCIGYFKFYRDSNRLIAELCQVIRPKYVLGRIINFSIDSNFKGAKNTYNNIILVLKDILETIPVNQLPLG